MKKKVTSSMVESNLKRVKKMKIDGSVVVIILGCLLKKAKKIQKQVKNKKLNSSQLHDLNIQSRTIRDLIDDMLVSLANEVLRQELRKKKRHAKVGRK